MPDLWTDLFHSTAEPIDRKPDIHDDLVRRAVQEYKEHVRIAHLTPLEARALKRYLRRECERLGIDKPDYLQ